MNILAKTKRYFLGPIKGGNGNWTRHPQFKEFLQACMDIFNSNSESAYVLNLAKLCTYNHDAVDYVKGTWLTPWKEKLVRYWVDQRLHFGVLVTSPIEGCHSTLKSYLQRGNGDLNRVFDRLELFWTAQQQGILQATAQDQMRPKHHTNIPTFAKLVGQIHGYALQKLLLELGRIPKDKLPNPECRCTIQGSIGLPCFHTIWARIKDGGVIQTEDIHPHWFYNMPSGSILSIYKQESIQVLNLIVIQGKGRPKGALGKGKTAPNSSTKRLPSAFELPPSTAPSALGRPPTPGEQLSIVRSGLTTTQIGMSRFIYGHIDLYEPGTTRERSYMSGMSSIYKDDCMEDTAKLADDMMQDETQDCIEVEVPSDSE
jgi:hypothetical protein